MKILDKAAKLEKALLDRLSRRTDIKRHPIEVYRDVLDDVEAACEPGSRGARIFPYHAITVLLPATTAHQRATAEAVFSESPSLEERVRTRLRHAGCADVDRVAVSLKFVDGTANEWSGRDYRLEYRRRATPPRPKGPLTARTNDHELHVIVLAGRAAKSRYSFRASCINIGRLTDVLDQQLRLVRTNQVAFIDGDDEASQSVSRTHAHVRVGASTGEARLHDDGSTHGTRVVRAGRTIPVPCGGGRGLTLHDGDEVLLGQARVRVELRPARRR